MQILFVVSEMAPFAKTGGLGEVASSLPCEIRALGHRVVCFLPKYKKVQMHRWPLRTVMDRLEIPVGSEKETGRIFGLEGEQEVPIYFIDQPEYFSRDELYGTPLGDYPDNDRRFIFFQRGVLEAIRKLEIQPDVIHCHDWQTGLIPVYLKTLYAKDSFFANVKTLFTIHNLAYQGNFPPDSLSLTGLGWEEFRMERLEFHGKVSFLKGGLVFSDLLTTVSPHYAEEIQTVEYGCGMEGVLRQRRSELVGILNGIHPEEWDPEKDPDIPQRFGLGKLEGKAANKKALQKENRFPLDPKIPLLGAIARMVDQKGLDLLAQALDDLMEEEIQLVLLGTGEEKYHQIFRELEKRYPGQFRVHIVFDPKMAKRIYAGADCFLMPSRYEPCGLGQLIALRFGSVPVVRAVGGLRDTVEDFDPKSGKGTGFAFEKYDPEALLQAVGRALSVYREPKLWQRLMRNGMKRDFSWRTSAEQYAQCYERLNKGR